MTVMSATGYSLGGAILWPLIGAVAASFIPGFKRLPGRFFVAFGGLMFCFSAFEAYRIWVAVQANISGP